MSLFPTRPTGPATGRPLRADPCRCGERQTLDQGSCMVCGRYPARTVEATFRRQAKLAARGQRDARPKLTLLTRPTGNDGRAVARTTLDVAA